MDKSSKNGNGTYVHVRDSGYKEPLGESQYLRAWMISLCILLLLASIAGTLLLFLPFYWNKQKESLQPATRHNINGDSSKSEEPKQPGKRAERAASLYMSLQPHSDDVYDVLDANVTDTKTENQHQVEVHDVVNQPPLRKPKPKPMIIPACFQETQAMTEIAPIKPVISSGIHENTQKGAEKSPVKLVKYNGNHENTKKGAEKSPVKLVKSQGMAERKQGGTEKPHIKQVKSAGAQEKSKGGTEKPQIKLEPQMEDVENSLYENLDS
ncbi:NFAT activation molecule 1 isoform 1-T1 [Discoglossus pictus]